MEAKEKALEKALDPKGVERALKLLEDVDKPMTKSKKFVGFLIIEFSWKALLFYAIYHGEGSATLMAMITAAGATETAFMGAQAWHDKHVKGEKLKAMNGSASATVRASLGETAKP